MIRVTTKRVAIITGVLMLAIGIGLYENVIRLPIEVKLERGELVTDFSNDRKLVGASHNVFIGRVIEERGSDDVFGMPITLFRVEVVANIKGALSGEISVGQEGGYKNGILYVVEDGDVVQPGEMEKEYFLQPGSTYLFAASLMNRERSYGLAPLQGATLITKDGTLSADALRNLAEDNRRVKELYAAYPSESVPESFALNDTAYNSFSDLSAEDRQWVMDEIARLGARERISGETSSPHESHRYVPVSPSGLEGNPKNPGVR